MSDEYDMLDSIYDLPMIEDHVTLNLCYDHEFAECAELSTVHSEHPVYNPCHVCPLNFWRNVARPYVLTTKYRNSNIHRLSIQRRKMGKHITDRRCQHGNRKRVCSKCNSCLICFNGEYGPANTILHR